MVTSSHWKYCSPATMSSCAICMAYQEQVVCCEDTLEPHTSIGRHCCLWCLITYEELQKPKALRDSFAERTLQNIKADHQRFLADIGDLKKAKFFNNAITDHFFDISIDHVC